MISNIGIIVIALGIIIMIFSLIESMKIYKILPFIKDRKHTRNYMRLANGLVLLFLIGYIYIFYVRLTNNEFILEDILISLILFFGSIFVFIIFKLVTHLLNSVQSSIEGLMPLCIVCKKIRQTGKDPEEMKSWVEIDKYLMEKASAKISHAFCPDCLEKNYPKTI